MKTDEIRYESVSYYIYYSKQDSFLSIRIPFLFLLSVSVFKLGKTDKIRKKATLTKGNSFFTRYYHVLNHNDLLHSVHRDITVSIGFLNLHQQQ